MNDTARRRPASAGSTRDAPAAAPAACFTGAGLAAGAVRIVPLLPALALYGMAFGLAAENAGLSVLETVAFSGAVYAGAAQMAALEAWSDPIPLAAIVTAVLAMNARYLLLGATLWPWMRTLRKRLAYPTLFVVGDGNWSLALKERQRGLDDAAFLLGSGAAMWVVWVAASALGHVLGAGLHDAGRYGIDVLLPAFFASMLAGFVRRPSDLGPFIVAALAAVVIDRLVPDPWSLVGGAVAGAGVALLRSEHAR